LQVLIQELKFQDPKMLRLGLKTIVNKSSSKVFSSKVLQRAQSTGVFKMATNPAVNGDAAISTNQPPKHDMASMEFMKKVSDMMLDEINQYEERDRPVMSFKSPEQILKLFDFDINEHGASEEELLKITKTIIDNSIKTGSPHFYNQLWQGLDTYGLAGAWITETMNTSQYTFEMAPIFTMMEQVVYKKMRELIGYENGNGDGIFTPGGSMANFYALIVARYRAFPEVRDKGVRGLPPLAIFTSEQGHYSIKKAAMFLGFGADSIYTVPANTDGTMKTELLEAAVLKAKADGYHPLMANATAGTTVLAAYDDLNAMADVCERHNIWFHVDGALGSSILCSKRYRDLMKGAERSDSVTWNPHKIFGIPLQCAAFLTKHQGLLIGAHSANAHYLFQQDKNYDVAYDTGDKSVQCGRKVDVLKFWMAWKAAGESGFEERIDRGIENARYLADQIKEREGFRLLVEPSSFNVGFWFIPPSLRGQEETKEWWDKLYKIAPKIKAKMMEDGSMMVGYQPNGGYGNFIRMVVHNPSLTRKDIDYVVDTVERLGLDL